MDRFRNSSDSVSHPARSLIEIDTTSSAILAETTKAIFVGTGGDIAVRAVDDNNMVVLRNVPSGSIVPVRVQQIDPAQTTADDLVGLL